DMKKTLMVWYAVTIVTYRKNAGIVLEAFLCQDVERPQTFSGYGVACGSVAYNSLANDVLHNTFGAPRLVSKLVARLRVNQLMRVAVRRDFVAAVRDNPDQVRRPFCNPSQNKKCRLHIAIVEQIKDALSIAFDSTFKLSPTIDSDHAFEGRYLIVILDIYAKRI